MTTFLLILTIVVFIKLVIITAMRPSHSALSIFELERRSASGDREAKTALARENLISDVISLQRIVAALLLVIGVLLSVVTFGWLIGIFVALLVTLEYGTLASIGFVNNWAQKIYKNIETPIFKFIKEYPYIFRFIRSMPNDSNVQTRRINSRQELQHLISSSGDALTPDEKKMIVNSLSFSDKLVSSIMTPRSMINSIEKSEYLGPLTLDDLHKVGHSRLPVISADIDHVVGILHLKNLLTLDTKRSSTVEKAMDPKVYYIRNDQTLSHALVAFLRTHHHLFIVVNEFRETVGLLTLEDVIETLLGRRIIDEFDAHDDLRSVALRNLNANNHPEKREDV